MRMLCLLLACSPTPIASDYEGDAAGECADAADNDRDGDFDCDDEGCAGSPDCETAVSDTGGPVGDTGDSASDDAALYAECTADGQLELYERYVEPLLTDEHPSTCNQCHVSGVDLSLYVQDTPCESMACMIEQGVVDLDDPEASAVLAQILQAEPDSDLITEDVIEAEYEGFHEWITWSAECHDVVCGDIDDACEAGGDDDEMPDVESPVGGCSEDALAALFEQKVWAWHGRCWSCHYEGGDLAEKYPGTPFYAWTGDEAESSLLTMYNVIGMGGIDTTNPTASSFLTKPLAEGVSASTVLGESTGIYHGGGNKFADAHDETLQDHADFIAAYLDCL